MAIESKPPQQRATYSIELLIVFLAYLVAGRIGLLTPFTSGNISPVWPAAGVALSAILLLGFRIFPAILAGAFLSNYLSPIPHLAAAGLAVGNTCSALLAAYILQSVPQFDRSLSRLRDVLALVLYGAFTGPLVSATLGVSVLYTTQIHAWSGVRAAWFVYWFGDAMGVLLVAPLFLTYQNLTKIRGFSRIIEALLLFATLATVCALIFANGALRTPELQLFAFAVFPFVIWAAMRFSVTGVSFASLVISNIAITSTFFGYGPFFRHSEFVNAVLLQIYLAVLCISGLLLAGAIAEREELVREQAAREARLRLAAIVESSEDAIVGTRPDGTITSWNHAAERLYGYSSQEALGRSISILIPRDRLGDFSAGLAAVRSGNPIHQLETVRRRKDGTNIDVSLSVSPIRDNEKYVIALADISRDVTQRRLAEQALRRADKLATTGRLAAAIAHEINNPLESLTNLLYLLISHPSLDENARSYARTAEEELNRTAYITRQMLSFHRSPDNPLPINVAKVLESVVDLYLPLIHSQAIHIVRRYETDDTIEGIPAELKQVFSNLLRNAIEAVGEQGTIQLHVYASKDWRCPDRHGIRIVIADNGRGIPIDLRNRIFDPFFTTKGEGGTGLGLWVGIGILQKRNGSIRFRSSTSAGHSGTVFSIFLPFGTTATEGNRVQAAD